MSETDFLIRYYNSRDLDRVLDIWESAARKVYPLFTEDDWNQE